MKSTKLVSKIKKYTIEHPTFVTIGFGFAFTLAIGTAIAILDPQQAFAKYCLNCVPCHTPVCN